MATKKKKAEQVEEVQNTTQAAEIDAQSVEEPKDTQTPTDEKQGVQSLTDASGSDDVTDLSDAPAEVKDEILKNAAALEAQAAPEPVALNIDEIDGLQLPGDFDDGQEEAGQQERWRIADDGCADWALKKIKAEKDELDRLTELANAEIARLQDKLAKAQRRYEQNTAFLTSMLGEYFQTVPHKKTKTGTETYQLLNGKLQMKPAAVKLVPDDAKLLEWLKQSGRGEMITVKESPQWGELKKQISTVGTIVMIGDTGEVVEGVTVAETAPQFSVKV